MKNTNCAENCCFVKQGFCKTDKECPFFVQTWWKNDLSPDPVIVSDCFPKKFALEQNHLLTKQIVLQSAIEETRNKLDDLEKSVSQLCNILSKKLELNKNVEENNFILADNGNVKSLE